MLDGSESSFWRSVLAGQTLFRGRREVKPSTEGWHILRAFWKLSSKVRPIAITCKGEHIRYGELLPSSPLSNRWVQGETTRMDRQRKLTAFKPLPKIATLALKQAQLAEPWECHC